MNRRSVLRLLGLAPVAAPAAVAAASAAGSIGGELSIGERKASFAFNPDTGTLRFQAQTFVIDHPNLPSGSARVTSEQRARTSADTDLAGFIGSVVSRPL